MRKLAILISWMRRQGLEWPHKIGRSQVECRMKLQALEVLVFDCCSFESMTTTYSMSLPKASDLIITRRGEFDSGEFVEVSRDVCERDNSPQL